MATYLELSRAMLELDLTQEAELDRLIELQVMQSELMPELEALFEASQRPLPQALQEWGQQAEELERALQKKLQLEKRLLEAESSQLQRGRQARSGYDTRPMQTEGYFIDKHK